MEVLGYLHTAVGFEDLEADAHSHSGDEENEQFSRGEASPTISSISPCFWIKRTSLGLSALVCSLSIILGSAPMASALMKYGDQNAQVTRLQNELASLGYFHTSSTGYFGTVTKTAVMRFQKDQGLVADGIVGPATLAALQSNAPTRQSAIAPSVTASRTVQSTVFQEVTLQRPPIHGLSRGDSGAKVFDLQRQLSRLGLFRESITGYFGGATEDAVIQFQRINGLSVTGIVDDRTQMVLVRAAGVPPIVRPVVQPAATQPVVQPAAIQPAGVPPVGGITVTTASVTSSTTASTTSSTVVTQPTVSSVVSQTAVRRAAPPPPPVLPVTTVLYRGDRNPDVIRLQQTLAAAGVYQGPITGYFGTLTEEAVLEFQRLNGIEPNGIAGPVTWDLLRKTVAVI